MDYYYDHVKSYAIAAFRFYAKEGRPMADEYTERLRNGFLNGSSDIYRSAAFERDIDADRGYGQRRLSSTERVTENLDRYLEHCKPAVDDIRAVELTLARLSAKGNGREIIKAVEYVYFAYPGEEIHKGDIALNVSKASIEIPASERQVYYWLKEARGVFVGARGLRAG